MLSFKTMVHNVLYNNWLSCGEMKRTYRSELDSTSPLSVFFPNSDAREPMRRTSDRLISPSRGIVAVAYDLMVWETGCIVQENRCKTVD